MQTGPDADGFVVTGRFESGFDLHCWDFCWAVVGMGELKKQALCMVV